ncbi:MAG: hypothetical protein ACE15C_14595 [Phycisphaerae bacterium]
MKPTIELFFTPEDRRALLRSHGIEPDETPGVRRTIGPRPARRGNSAY